RVATYVVVFSTERYTLAALFRSSFYWVAKNTPSEPTKSAPGRLDRPRVRRDLPGQNYEHCSAASDRIGFDLRDCQSLRAEKIARSCSAFRCVDRIRGCAARAL